MTPVAQALVELGRWLESSAVATAIAESTWMFAAINTVHVIAASFVVGSIAVLDLRLLGAAWRKRTVTAVADEVLPWTWVAFAFAVLSGSLLFVAEASKCIVDVLFQIKMLLLLLAGGNMLGFHVVTYRGVAAWNAGVSPPRAAKAAALLSLLFWVGIIVCGRWMGFTTQDVALPQVPLQ